MVVVVGGCCASVAVVLGVGMKFGMLAFVPGLCLLIALGALALRLSRRHQATGATYIDEWIGLTGFWDRDGLRGIIAGALMVAFGNWGGAILIPPFSYFAHQTARSLPIIAM